MRQVLGWLSVLLFFGACGAGWYLQRGPEEAQAADATQFIYADYNLSQAAAKLEQLGSVLGSYDSIPADLIVGMTIRRAAGQQYCVELVREGHWFHRAGPGGATARGRCYDV